jgi:hypothetical protein
MNFLRTSAVLSCVCLTFLGACGGSSSTNDPVALCKQGCAKGVSLCYADAGDTGPTYKAVCESACATAAAEAKMCSNSSAITAAYKVCLNKTTCDDLMACSQALPDCIAGGGGSSGGGTGGSSGTGGTSGTGTACADLLKCCNASTSPDLKKACTDAIATAMGMDATCAQVLGLYKGTICP